MINNPPHRSTQRALDILVLLSQGEKPAYSLAEIAVELEAPKSSLLPILQTLAMNDFLNYHAASASYSMGIKAFETGMSFLRSNNAFANIQTELQKIVNICSETCNVAQLNGNEVCCLFKVDSPEPIRMFSAPGKRMPAHATALGKALLSEKSMDDLKQLFPDGLKKVTDNTITDIDILYEQLQEIKRTGVAHECEEIQPMIRCIAVPVKISNYPAYAISISLPVFRYTEEKEALIMDTLRQERIQMESLMSAWDMETA